MRLCSCGHRDARHDQLDGEVRGECMACSCPFFEDVKSSIEEEIAASTYRVPSAHGARRPALHPVERAG
jgi:hypothetical protein